MRRKTYSANFKYFIRSYKPQFSTQSHRKHLLKWKSVIFELLFPTSNKKDKL